MQNLSGDFAVADGVETAHLRQYLKRLDAVWVRGEEYYNERLGRTISAIDTPENRRHALQTMAALTLEIERRKQWAWQ